MTGQLASQSRYDTGQHTAEYGKVHKAVNHLRRDVLSVPVVSVAVVGSTTAWSYC